MSTVSGVIFDLDNTLVHSSNLECYRESGDRDGLKENLHKSRLFDPVVSVLREIKSKSIPLALVTNSPRWYTEAILEYHELDCFDVVITYNEVGFDGSKPSAKGILMALDQMGCNKLDCAVYVGDHEDDVIAAYTAGILPIVPSWATRIPVDQVPVAILNSETFISALDNVEEMFLIADRIALHKRFDIPKSQMNFLPLNDKCKVVALRKPDIKLIAFGRYFSQGTALTARMHESHQLSRDIFRKEESQTYLIPQYYVDFISKVVESLPEYVFEEAGSEFDIVTVIPAKRGKNPRLENLLKRVQASASSGSTFISDLFEFSAAAKSLKTLGGKESRLAQLDDNFSLKEKYRQTIAGKTILIIDDVITTGATFQKAFSLLESSGSTLTFGVCLAKTVSFKENTRFCPHCGRILKVRRNKQGIHFYGCSGFYEDGVRCRYTEEIPVKDCPRCEAFLVKRYSKVNDQFFLSCVSFGTPNQCGYTESVD